MHFLRRIDRIIFFVLVIGVGILTWNLIKTYPQRSQNLFHTEPFGQTLNEQRKVLKLEPVLASDQAQVTRDSSGTYHLYWLPTQIPAINRPHFWKKEMAIRQQKLVRETDTYYYPLPKGHHLMHFDYYPDSTANRQLQTRLEVAGLPTISSFEIPVTKAAQLFRDSLLQEWKINLRHLKE